tara:strand:+ start:184 stop:984 length:801 start_codon:yes stop_codon:yes gene_type:complete
MDNTLIQEHLLNAYPSMVESFTRRNESSVVRPSAFLACARQMYIKVCERIAPDDMPDNIGSTFAVGHLLHEVSYAAVKSALPDGFKVETEKEVKLPDWWPDDKLNFNQEGHVDMFISIEDTEQARKFLPDAVVDEQPKMLVDFKTMGSFSYRKHSKADYSQAVDGFGYLSQLAVYSSALDVIGNGAILAGINRDSLTLPLMPRFISPSILMKEQERIKMAFLNTKIEQDPGAEFQVRHGTEADFYCGLNGKTGYCPYKKACARMGQ